MKTQYVQTMADLAVVLGISRRSLSDWKRRPGFPKKSAQGWNVLKVRDWRNRWFAAADDDPLLEGGGTSRWLESYRREKTMLIRLQRASQMGLLRTAEETSEMIDLVANRLRKAIQQVQVEFGQGPYDVMVEALADLERTFQHWQPQVTVETLLSSMDQDSEPADCCNKKRKGKNVRSK